MPSQVKTNTSQNASQNIPGSTKSFEAKFARVMEACGASNDSELARILNITPPSVGTARKRRKIPSGWVEKIAETFDVSADWLFFGKGLKQSDNAQTAPAEAQNACLIPPGEPQWMSPEAAPAMGYSLIPKVKARLCAGTGSLETEGEVIGYYAFKTDFLRRKGRPKKMVLMDITGDSMSPVLMDRDSVLIDESQNEIIAGGIFAVGIDSEVYVKYLDKIPGKLILRSKNTEYHPIEVDMNGELSDSVRVIGRIVWSCREYVR
ncbi:helix-turn-helix domain-containing protein [Desulfovibrio sp. JY]|nr:helix-turn-helix domain-containing protein [Desulfovibrio sp. JY]